MRLRTNRTRQGTTDWFQIGKGVHQGFILSLCLFNFYAEYIMQNARLDEEQAGIKIAGRNINNLRYADFSTLMAESKELKRLLIRVKKESEKASLKFNIKKTGIISVPSFHGKEMGKKMEKGTDFIFWGSKILVDSHCSHEIKRCLFLGRRVMTNLDSIL